jgi:predicted N-acetyltransferase YhbS
MSFPFELSPFTAADVAAVDMMLDQAFGLSRRTKTSYRLREGNTAVPELSQVVRDPEVGIAGVISYWPVKIGVAGTDALLLGPLAIHKDRQNQGIGKALMEQTLTKAKALGHGLVILVGDAPYYARVGFAQIPEGQMLLPGPTDPKRFLALELREGALSKAQGLVLPAHRWRA